MEIFSELEEMRKNKFTDITSWKCKMVEKQYAFELPLKHGSHKFVKIKYPATMKPLPLNLTGKNFKCLFGSNQSMLEKFLLSRKIFGPCWLTVKNAKKTVSNPKTWSKLEVELSCPKSVEQTIDDRNRDAPPLVGLCFSIKQARSKNNTNEIAMISVAVHQNIL